MKTTLTIGTVVVEVPSESWEREVSRQGVVLTDEQRRECLPRTIIFKRNMGSGNVLGQESALVSDTERVYLREARKTAKAALIAAS